MRRGQRAGALKGAFWTVSGVDAEGEDVAETADRADELNLSRKSATREPPTADRDREKRPSGNLR